MPDPGKNYAKTTVFGFFQHALGGLCLWPVACVAFFSLDAGAAYLCRDYAGNTYRLPAAHIKSEAMHCVDVVDPEIQRALPPASVQPTEDLKATLRSRMAVLIQPISKPPPQSIRRFAPITNAFDSALHEAAMRHDLDVNLIKAIVYVESRFKPNAVSPKGAIGLMQVMPATARWMGVEQPMRDLFIPEQNIHVGAKYLRRLLNLFVGRPELAVAAYNAGEGAVIRHDYTIPPFPETIAYVEKVRARYIYLRENEALHLNP